MNILTKQELAKTLKVSLKTVDNLRGRGMPYFNIGDTVRFDAQEVQKWLLQDNRVRMITKACHQSGHVRDTLLEALCQNEVEWWEYFENKEQLSKTLSDLGRCPDVVPSDAREEAANWLKKQGVKESTLFKIEGGCSYSFLVWHLRRSLPKINNFKE